MQSWVIPVAVWGVGCGPEPSPCADDARPETIAEMVDHLDSLPAPVDAACIVHSLERPLQVEATNNPFSAQPAEGLRSPRIFIFSGDLSISLVPTGIGSEVVEFGQRIDDDTTLKGELVLPITAPLDPMAPHDRIRDEGDVSICRICHIEEEPFPLPNDGIGFASIAIQPDAESIVDLALLGDLATDCNEGLEPERCRLLNALFVDEVERQAFPAHLPTIFDLQPE